jgi:hypothetical protein
MGDPIISVINPSTVMKDSDVETLVPALHRQVQEHFQPWWHVGASLDFVPQGSSPKPGSWWLTILDNFDQAGALGYHDVTNEGLPLAKDFAASDLSTGTPTDSSHSVATERGEVLTSA